MTTFENLLTSANDGVFTITINRPDKLNALNKNTIREIGEAVEQAIKDSGIRVIILTGAGAKAFVAGADISEFSHFGEAEGAGLAKHGHDVFKSIENSPKPVIAAINGFALGGGCELAMSCHLRVAAENAKFGQPEVKLGLIPGYGGTQRLPMLIGRTKALELLMTADMIGAAEALQLGLVNYVTPSDQLIAKCLEIASKIKSQAPLAIAGIIKSVNDHYEEGTNGFDSEIREFGKCFVTEDFKEGTSAFLEKRKADFKRKVVLHKTVSIKVTGRVQGVFFRKFTLQAALKYQLCGYVKNAPDGSVIIQASGNEQNINSFIQWCHQGSPSSKVDKVIVEEVEPHTYIDFVIRY